MMTHYNPPPLYAICPKCNHTEVDHFGVGFKHCQVCGYCTHPEMIGCSDGTVACSYCGSKVFSIGYT